jgi:hypothetical protein
VAVVQTRRHEEFARALGRRLVEERRLDVDEAVPVEEAARRARCAVAQAQVGLHRRPTQVEHAVLQAHFLGEVVLVDLERRRRRGIEDLDFLRRQLHLSGLQFNVAAALRSLAQDAFHPKDIFVANLLGNPECVTGVGVEDHLSQALAVAQIDEDHATVVAPPVRPAAQRHALADEGGADFAAVVGAHRPIGAAPRPSR